jgi:hypothetical protein
MFCAGVGNDINVELVDVTPSKVRPFVGQLRLYAFRTTRYVPPGEELLTDYGSSYGARTW